MFRFIDKCLLLDPAIVIFILFYLRKPNDIKKDKEIIPDEKEKIIFNPISQDIKNKDIEESNATPSGMPVPQVKLGPNGEIVIDEQSLVNIYNIK